MRNRTPGFHTRVQPIAYRRSTAHNQGVVLGNLLQQLLVAHACGLGQVHPYTCTVMDKCTPGHYANTHCTHKATPERWVTLWPRSLRSSTATASMGSLNSTLAQRDDAAAACQGVPAATAAAAGVAVRRAKADSEEGEGRGIDSPRGRRAPAARRATRLGGWVWMAVGKV